MTRTLVLACLLAGCAAQKDSPAPDGGASSPDLAMPPNRAPSGKLQMNDLSVMFPLGQATSDIDAHLAPSSMGRGGALLPQAIFGAANDTTGIDYASLRVVALRFDPCFASLDPTSTSNCLNQLRVILQPLSFDGTEVVADDAAVHAFYTLTRAELTAALAAIGSLRAENGGTSDLGGLQVHPIMAQQGVAGPMAAGLDAIVAQYAGAANLTRFTMFRSSSVFAPTQPGATGEARFWNFHGFDVANGAVTPMIIPALAAGTTDINFSITAVQPLYGTFSAATVGGDDLQLLASYTSATQASAADRQTAYDAALRIENPATNSPNTTDCASCHVAQASRQLVGALFGLTAAGNANAFVAAPSIPTADTNGATPAVLADGQELSVHAFSYRNATPEINTRVVNETAAILAYLQADSLAP